MSLDLVPRLLIATANQGKLREFQLLLGDIDNQVVSLNDVLNEIFDVAETGTTFEENAQLKAHAYTDYFQGLVLAEDAGLMVTALDGAPGLKSKRFHPGSDEDRNQAILRHLAGEEDRTAEFISVLCLYDTQSDQDWVVEGRVSGSIAEQPRGDHGFAYDRIFIPEGYNQTLAQLGDEVKLTLSHRARAVEKILPIIKENTHG